MRGCAEASQRNVSVMDAYGCSECPGASERPDHECKMKQELAIDVNIPDDITPSQRHRRDSLEVPLSTIISLITSLPLKRPLSSLDGLRATHKRGCHVRTSLHPLPPFFYRASLLWTLHDFAELKQTCPPIDNHAHQAPSIAGNTY